MITISLKAAKSDFYESIPEISKDKPSLEAKQRIFNGTRKPIVIARVDGTLTELHPVKLPGEYAGKILIRHSNYISGNGMSDSFSPTEGSGDQLGKIVRDAWAKGNLYHSYDEVIDPSPLQEHRKAIYVPSSNLTVYKYYEDAKRHGNIQCSQKLLNDFVNHIPVNMFGEVDEEFPPTLEQERELSENTVRLGFRLVRNEPGTKKVYTIVNGKVLEIRSVEMPNLKEGMYYTPLNQLADEEVIFYEEDDIYVDDEKDFLFFRTRKEANLYQETKILDTEKTDIENNHEKAKLYNDGIAYGRLVERDLTKVELEDVNHKATTTTDRNSFTDVKLDNQLVDVNSKYEEEAEVRREILKGELEVLRMEQERMREDSKLKIEDNRKSIELLRNFAIGLTAVFGLVKIFT